MMVFLLAHGHREMRNRIQQSTIQSYHSFHTGVENEGEGEGEAHIKDSNSGWTPRERMNECNRQVFIIC